MQMEFEEARVGKSHSSEHLSAQLRTSKPAQGSSPSQTAAWPFARHNISSNLASLGLKPGTPESLPQTQQKTSLLFDPSQQLKQQNVQYLDHVDNFGVDIKLHTANQMAPSTKFAVLDAAGYFSVSARRSPAHSRSPVAVSMDGPVDVSIEPKLGTHRPQTVSDPSHDLSNESPIFNSPEDLMGEHLLQGGVLEKVIGFQTPIKQSRLKHKRGKFQLQGRQGKKFILSDILGNLPCSRQKLKLRAKKELRAEKLTKAPQRDVFSMSASHSCEQQESSANQSSDKASESPAMATRRLTRLQQRKLKTSTNLQSKSSQSASGRRATDQTHPGKPQKETVKQRQQVRLGGTNSITKNRHLHRNLVKFQQNRQRHLGYLGGAATGSSTQGQDSSNVIMGGSIGDMHVKAFEIHQASLQPQVDGLWKMEKGHIYSQQQESSVPQISPPGRSWQQQELNRTPPSRQAAAQFNNQIISAQHSQQQLMAQQHNEPLRDGSQGASSDERELFTIFSGLRVVTMAGRPNNDGFPTTSTGQGVPTQQRERPYRWSPSQPMAQPASHPRLSSV